MKATDQGTTEQEGNRTTLNKAGAQDYQGKSKRTGVYENKTSDQVRK